MGVLEIPDDTPAAADAEPASPADLFAFLDRHGLTYQTHSHPPVYTVEESKALRGDLPGAHCKNLLVRNRKKSLWLIVALESTPVQLKPLAKRLGAGQFSFASPERLMDALGVTPGAVTPFGLINDREARVSLVLDEALMAFESLNFHPLTNDATTAISREDFLRFVSATGHEPTISALA